MFLTFSKLWKLLSIFRSLAADYDVQLLGDVTAKASTAALNKLRIGVNMLGNQHRAHFYLVVLEVPHRRQGGVVLELPCSRLRKANALTRAAILR